MKNIIVITGHAHYATGMLSSLEMIAGVNADFIAVDFNDGVDVSQIYKDIVANHEQDSILFVCDLLGGTPFKEASKIAFSNINIEVVIGCNLGSLLGVSLTKDTLNLDGLVSKIINDSVKNTTHLEKNKINTKVEVITDGI